MCAGQTYGELCVLERSTAHTPLHTLCASCFLTLLLLPSFSLSGQTYGELCVLERSMQASLESGQGDPEYWEGVIRRLKIHKVRLSDSVCVSCCVCCVLCVWVVCAVVCVLLLLCVPFDAHMPRAAHM